MKKVKEYMSKKVISFKKSDPLLKVATTFYEKDISGAPVVEKGKTVGIITSADIYEQLRGKLEALNVNVVNPRSASIGLLVASSDKSLKKTLGKFHNAKVQNIMRKKFVSVEPEASLFKATKIMGKHRVTKLPVIKNKKLVGMLTKSDIVRAFIG